MMMVGSKPHSLKLEFDEYTKHSKFVLKSENYTEQVFIKLGLSWKEVTELFLFLS
jgi:hypothetical protein